MVVKKLNDIKIYQRAIKLKRIGNQSVKKAHEENKKFGIPSVYSSRGKLFYEMPNGEITRIDPFI